MTRFSRLARITAVSYTHLDVYKRQPYSREKAAYPLDWVREHKFFASVSRVDEAYGDRNLICTCAPIEEYM